MNTHCKVKSVWRQTSSVSGNYRLRDLELLMGKEKTETYYKEYSCVYKVDLRKAYFSPRLSYEHLRIAKLVQSGEVVLNMFAGVGCFSISISKHAEPKRIFSIDLNPNAFYYLCENIRLNRAEKTIIPIQADSKTVIQNKLKNRSDRILMPLPKKAYEYLDYAFLALKPRGGYIHYYDFEYAKKNQNPVKKAEMKVSEKMRSLGYNFQVEYGRIVRPIGPHWYQVVLDIHIKKK